MGTQSADRVRPTAQRNERTDRIHGRRRCPAVAWTPLADVTESDGAFHVEIELPGVKSKDINVEANGQELVVTGEIKEKEHHRPQSRGRKAPARRDRRDESKHRAQRLRRERRGYGHPSGTAAGPPRLNTQAGCRPDRHRPCPDPWSRHTG
ncbi:Hsp20/alpha crystallin family protein [Streptomyces phaeochromogenes]|uniref:Hsp20/alpha crystallin family protein n=1 Tax=Streptomyces phaeochromogenes TaxID=1923 RepID=UPI00386499BF